ncbi:MAG TPA: glutaredoxin domain-containing protein [Acidimicrobiia bacterium]|nr:glutaredoxin domain-containing protein [Acidimicrobiia bacterium]
MPHPSVEPGPEIDAIDFYTRAGCGISLMLQRALVRRGVPIRVHDIWVDPDAAARVRAAARGHETVPTIGIGAKVMVNPRASDVVGVLERLAPQLLGEPPPPGLWRRLRHRYRWVFNLRT